MIWARITWILLLALSAGIFAAWLADDPGSLSVRWRGWQIDTTIAAVLAFMAALVGFFVLLRRLARMFMRKT